MRVVKDFTDEQDMNQIIEAMTAEGAILLETQYHFDGNHLIFETNQPPRDLETEIDDLKARVEKLEKK